MSETATGGQSVATPGRRERFGIWTLAGASAISNFGNMLTFLAIPWFVLVTTGSAARTGLAGAVVALVPIVAGFVGGPIVDRVGFKRASILADLASGATVALIPTLHLLDVLAYWHLLVLAFLGAVLDVPGFTARQALVPGLARRAGVSLERANSVMQLTWTLAGSLLGAVLGGLLIAVLGPAQVLYVDAATFAASMLIVGLAVRPPARDPIADDEAEEEDGDGSYGGQLLAGVRLVRRDAVLMTILPVAVLLNFVGTVFIAVILPVYAREAFDSVSVFGLLVGATGAGSTLGAIAYGVWGHCVRRYRLMLVLFSTSSVAVWLFALVTFLPSDLLARFAVGLSNGPVSAMAMVLIQTRVPERMLGRVMGILVTLASAAGPLGVLIAGFAIDIAGLDATLIGAATLITVAPLWLALNPRSRAAAPAFDER